MGCIGFKDGHLSRRAALHVAGTAADEPLAALQITKDLFVRLVFQQIIQQRVGRKGLVAQDAVRIYADDVVMI